MMLFTLTGSTVWDNRCFKYQSKLQIPQGLQQSDEDELYEEVEDTRKQQFTTWYYLFYPAQSAEFKVYITSL